MPKNTTLSGRPRSSKEQLFTRALTDELNREQARRGMDQRAFADFLHIHESLLSYYRSGQRHPSQMAMGDIDEKLPGFWLRVIQGYYRLIWRRDRDEQDRTPADSEDDLVLELIGGMTRA